MLTFTIRRLIISAPTLLIISFAIFMLMELSPGDPMSQVPLTVPSEVKERMREALGLGEPPLIRFWKWLVQILVIEPAVFIDWLTRDSFLLGWLPDTSLYGGQQRVISWQTRGPVMDIIVQRLPQTLWVVGLAYLVGVLIALPIGIISAYRQYSWFDNAGTFIAMIGFAVPPFLSGVLVIVVFSVWLRWLPSIYDTTHVVNDWDSFVVQFKQMIMPVMVLALQTTAQISRFLRASMLDNLGQDYVRTARAKGLKERTVVLVHVLRNSLIPVVSVIAIGIPSIFGGAIITEQIFKVNGIGQLFITALQANDIPMVLTVAFFFAFLIVAFSLIADILYGVMDPRIRYD